MLEFVTIKGANLNLSPLIEAVQSGKTIVLTSYGKPVAMLTGVEFVAGEMSREQINLLLEGRCASV